MNNDNEYMNNDNEYMNNDNEYVNFVFVLPKYY